MFYVTLVWWHRKVVSLFVLIDMLVLGEDLHPGGKSCDWMGCPWWFHGSLPWNGFGVGIVLATGGKGDCARSRKGFLSQVEGRKAMYLLTFSGIVMPRAAASTLSPGNCRPGVRGLLLADSKLLAFGCALSTQCNSQDAGLCWSDVYPKQPAALQVPHLWNVTAGSLKWVEKCVCACVCVQKSTYILF